MLHYYIAYSLMLIVALFTAGKQSKARSMCIAFAMIWIVVLGFRHPSMGVDLSYQSDYGYLALFEYISDLPWKEVLTEEILNYERGYIILNKLIGYLSSDSQILIFACSIISITIAAVVFFRNSSYQLLSAIIYVALPCFLMNFSGLRQALAIAITFAAFEMIKSKKIIWFLVLVSLAGLFHSSAFIFLVAYPLYYVRFGKTESVITVLVPLAVYAFRSPLFRIFSKLFKENAVVDNNGSVGLFIIFWLVYVFCIVLGDDRDELEIGVRNLFLIACVFQAFSGLYYTAMRAGYYFMMYLTLLLPRIIENSQKDKNDLHGRSSGILIYVCILAAFAVYGLFRLSTATWAMTNPHTFFWQ